MISNFNQSLQTLHKIDFFLGGGGISIRNEAKVFLGEENHKMQNCRKTKTTAIMEAKKYLQPHLLGVAIRTTLLHAVVKAESSGIENEQNELNYHQSGVGTYLVKIS